jgi:hypothetical protein
MKSLFLFAAATSAVLASAAFATPGPGGGLPHQARRAGDRLTVLTDDQEMMCKIPNVRAGHAGKASGGPDWERTAVYLDHVGQISCLGRMPVKD